MVWNWAFAEVMRKMSLWRLLCILAVAVGGVFWSFGWASVDCGLAVGDSSSASECCRSQHGQEVSAG